MLGKVSRLDKPVHAKTLSSLNIFIKCGGILIDRARISERSLTGYTVALTFTTATPVTDLLIRLSVAAQEFGNFRIINA